MDGPFSAATQVINDANARAARADSRSLQFI
jgi:hypothetical protein